MSINFSNKPQLFFLYKNIVFFLHLLTLITRSRKRSYDGDEFRHLKEET